MNKRGFMLGEYTLKMIIAIFCIILLLYLLFNFYSSFTAKQNFTRAEATLNSFIEKMGDAKKNPGNLVSLPLLEPNNWILISYSGLEKPESCTKDCICLCEGVNWKDKAKFWSGINQLDKCEIRGVCKNFMEKINNLNIKLRTEINIEYKDGGYVISEKK